MPKFSEKIEVYIFKWIELLFKENDLQNLKGDILQIGCCETGLISQFICSLFYPDILYCIDEWNNVETYNQFIDNITEITKSNYHITTDFKIIEKYKNPIKFLLIDFEKLTDNIKNSIIDFIKNNFKKGVIVFINFKNNKDLIDKYFKDNYVNINDIAFIQK